MEMSFPSMDKCTYSRFVFSALLGTAEVPWRAFLSGSPVIVWTPAKNE